MLRGRGSAEYDVDMIRRWWGRLASGKPEGLRGTGSQGSLTRGVT